ncbi:PAS domain-containing sensor histidine kinase [Methylovirgula sp. HY1]|uniref:sensor histidine kinase n=1 Tax=Methylovirgula sp. HY1 TaxID=2822761 RepID=UPI001C5B42B5|nr:PAS domain-containing sensor histidine kinase [Methylovirgula sp. HY1]QXX76318.1 Sensor protein DivL [Methylovirgula sp. HY1]
MQDAARQGGGGTEQKRRKAFALLAIFGARLAGILYLVTAATEAFARPADPIVLIDGLRQSQDVIGLSFIVGLVLFSTITALLHLRERHQWGKTAAAYQLDLTNLRAKVDRADVFLAAEPQIIVAWDGPGGEADIEGDLSLVTDVPISRRVLGFGSWLTPDRAQSLDACVDSLRQKGEGFRFALESLGGRRLEIEGRAVSGRAVMRIRDVSGDRLEAVRLRERLVSTIAELDALRGLLNAVDSPAWLRDHDSRLTWVNAAYVRAVEAADPTDAILHGTELLERSTREASALARATGAIWRGRAAAVAAGQRRTLDIVEAPAPAGSAGIAADISELEAMRGDLDRQMQAHARTLDLLSTSVAMFDRHKRLVFHNAAYRQLWSLDQAFVDLHPTDAEILDTLRARGLLPEQADFRAWKHQLHQAYQAIETSEHVWYLPDGRTLRVVITPNPQGGVTYLFDDVTERFHLQSQFNALTRVQSETLDTLKEGVAVFGTDGRLKFFNPAFSRLLKLDASLLNDKPHIDRIAPLCALFGEDEAGFAEIRGIITGLHDRRTGFERRIACRDGTVLDCAAQPLPDGATLLTFTDTTASVNVERALTERNQALIEAETLRNDFVHHVSYELRSPLTNIIGFIGLLSDGTVGALNERQREYAGYVTQSSTALLAIINNILDLASIDADALELSPGDVDIRTMMYEAAEGVQDRVAESSIHLQLVALDGVGAFVADAKRIRQILFNLLSNAVGFSAPGQTVTLAAMRREDEIIFKVTDQGRGIPPEVLDHVFGRFRSHTSGSRHRGVGLGLSIVRSLVELHGGRVLIDSVPGEGTTVTCIFPAQGVQATRTKTA